jgi:hypothetical protein
MARISDGTYPGKPVSMALIVSQKKKTPLLRITCEIIVPDDGGENRTHRVTKSCALTQNAYQYTVLDAELCGADTSQSVDKWKPNVKLDVRCRVENDDYGPKLKSIFKDDGEDGFVASQEKPTAAMIATINEQIRVTKAMMASGELKPASKKDSDDDVPF